MVRRGEVFVNPITGVRAVVQVGTCETHGQRLVADLDVRKCGVGSPLHLHPVIFERLTVVSGRVGISLHDKTSIAEVGSTIEIPPGVPHRWWNAGIYEAKVTIDVEPAARYEEYMRNLFGLAQDGKTDSMGTPRLLQFAVIAQEFADVIRFLKPAKLLPGPLFPAMAPVGRFFGYRGSYGEYLSRPPSQILGPDLKPMENLDSGFARGA
jgi:mannose-6-phosphate isomerase-like protein (cupin superfamily)